MHASKLGSMLWTSRGALGMSDFATLAEEVEVADDASTEIKRRT